MQPDSVGQEPEQIVAASYEVVIVDPMQDAFAINDLMRRVQAQQIPFNDLFSFRNPLLAGFFVIFQLFGCLLNHDVTVVMVTDAEIFEPGGLTAALI